MRGASRLSLKALIGACAGALLVACSTVPPQAPQAQSQVQTPQAHSQVQAPPPPLAPVPAAAETATATPVPPIGPAAYAPPPPSVSYPRYGDSDDYLCNFAPPGDPRTPQACIRLRGPDAVPQPPAHFSDTDDFVCNHGTPGDPRTIEACLRLRPPGP
jgi:hypothetical protein